jgi:hypothetical protein
LERHIIIEKCSKCPFCKVRRYWGHKKCCNYIKNGSSCYGKEINHKTLKGKKFPEFCPLEKYETERCDKIQLKRKKMKDYIKKRKKCKK